MVPTVVETGSDDIFFLTRSDRKLINFLIEIARKELANTSPVRAEAESFTDSPDTYIAKLTADIPARAGTTPGRVQCEIYKIVPATATDPDGSAPTLTAITLPDATPLKYYVYNLYPVKWYSAANPYIRITREKFGFFLCERPAFRHKAKAKADITAGNFANTGLYIAGAEVDVVSGYNNWMNSGVKISNLKEGIIEYFEDEAHWVWVEAECET